MTWEPTHVIMDMGEYGGLPQEQNGCSDAGIIVDRLVTVKSRQVQRAMLAEYARASDSFALLIGRTVGFARSMC